MPNPPPHGPASPLSAFLRPLHLGVLGAGGVVAAGALAAAGTLGTALPALGVVVLTALAYGGVVGADLLGRPSGPPPPPPRPADDLDVRLEGILAAANRLEPLFAEGALGMIEARARVKGVLDEAREAVDRTRQLRGILVELPASELDEDVRELEKEVAAARDEGARTILKAALEARRARRAGRRALVGLEERGRAALTLAESVLDEMGTRLSRLAHDESAPGNEGVLSEIEALHRELSALQTATAATLAELGALR
jgi:hypothetical protein